MALYKPIEMPNGITLSYHRVCDVQITVNQQINIQVASYISQAKREEERQAYATNSPMNVYVEGRWYTAEYTNAGISPREAYEFLKTLPEFEGAQDVWEDAQ